MQLKSWLTFFIRISAALGLGYTFSAMLLQPVVIAVFVGLLLGNMQTAMIIGAGMQLVYLG
ncbi:PTS sugar transporter subunit IIC, partial [Salmonella enterica subsp. enterica serovar Anatum]|nr:PTS sugar transporter subunit IIC [Salmonella enterica subsp. enterica serovar Anatum]